MSSNLYGISENTFEYITPGFYNYIKHLEYTLLDSEFSFILTIYGSMLSGVYFFMINMM